MSFYFINVGTEGKYKNVGKKIHTSNKLQFQLMSFYYINIEIKKKRMCKKNSIWQNGFLLYPTEVIVRNNRKI